MNRCFCCFPCSRDRCRLEESLASFLMEFSHPGGESRGQSLGRWLSEMINHAFGNPREEAQHQPPLVGVQPYRDRPLRRGAR